MNITSAAYANIAGNRSVYLGGWLVTTASTNSSPEKLGSCPQICHAAVVGLSLSWIDLEAQGRGRP